jgi:gluconate 2-dehydrogenase gamma chain
MISPNDFKQLQEPWDERMRAIAEERLRTNYAREKLENFTEEEAAIMRAALDRLIPQDEEIDLVGFIDGRLWDPLGRGDRGVGMPEEKEVLKIGLRGLDESAQTLFATPFIRLEGGQQDEILDQVQDNKAPGESWQQVPGDYFFHRLYSRALTGYYAHPRVWMRIGFYGASYPEGYAWLGRGQVKQRHERAVGWERL